MKGKTGEREFAKMRGVQRTPGSGAMGGTRYSQDVIEPNTPLEDWRWSVKRYAAACKTLYSWLELLPGHGEKTMKHTPKVENKKMEPPNAVAFRMDASPWLVVMTYAEFERLWPQRAMLADLEKE